MKVLRLVLLASLALSAVLSAVGLTNNNINTKILADHPHHNDYDSNESIGRGGNGEVLLVKNQGRENRKFAEGKGRLDDRRYTALNRAISKAVQQLKDLAKDLAYRVAKAAMQKERTGYYTTATGSGIAFISGAIGLVATSPLIPAAIVMGSVVGAAGVIFNALAAGESDHERERIKAKKNQILEDLNMAIIEATQHLVGTHDDNNEVELDMLLNKLQEEMAAMPAADPAADGNTDQQPYLREFVSRVQNLKRDYEKLPPHRRQEVKAFLSVVGLSTVAKGGPENICSHGLLSPCDMGIPEHINCYSKWGKAVYTAGMAVNIASTMWSVWEATELTGKLDQLEANEKAGSERYWDDELASHLVKLANQLEERMQRFSDYHGFNFP